MPTQYDSKLKKLQRGASRQGRYPVGVGLLLLAVLLIIWQAWEQHNIQQREFSRLLTQSGVVYHDLRRQLMSIRASHINLQAELLSDEAGFEPARPFIDKRLRAFVQTIAGVRTVTLLDADLSILASSDPLHQQGSLAGNELVQKVLQKPQAGILYISRPYHLNEQLLTIAVASVLTDHHGAFSGMVMTELNPAEIGALLASVFYTDDMQASIVHADGTIFLAEPGSAEVLGMNLSGKGSVFSKHVDSGNSLSTYQGKLFYRNERLLLVQQTIMPAELNTSDALVVRIGREHDAVFAGLNRSRWFMAGLYLLLAVISLTFLQLWQRKSRQAFTELSETQNQVLANNELLVRLNRQLEQQTENMRSLAFLDELVRIANRRHFNRSLEAEWRRCQREQQPLSLVILDVDYFKQFNDLYGHQRGDDCLIRIAGSLKNSLTRSHDLPARIGGEEFACLLPNTPLQGALVKAERIRSEIEALDIPHGGSLVKPVVTVSVGVASVMPESGAGYLKLLELADEALYQSKKKGRNRVCGQTVESAAAGRLSRFVDADKEGDRTDENMD